MYTRKYFVITVSTFFSVQCFVLDSALVCGIYIFHNPKYILASRMYFQTLLSLLLRRFFWDSASTCAVFAVFSIIPKKILPSRMYFQTLQWQWTMPCIFFFQDCAAREFGTLYIENFRNESMTVELYDSVFINNRAVFSAGGIEFPAGNGERGTVFRGGACFWVCAERINSTANLLLPYVLPRSVTLIFKLYYYVCALSFESTSGNIW